MRPALCSSSFTRGAIVFALAIAAARSVPAQTGSGAQIVLGATVAERREAARALVPLLRDVKTHAAPGVDVTTGGAPPSKLTGRPSTLFAFTFSKKQVQVDPRVIAAMDRLLAWNPSTAGVDDQLVLFDNWLVELQSRTAAAKLLNSGAAVCDLACVVTSATTLDERWGRTSNGRADARDELLLDAMTAAVTKAR